MTKKLKQGKKAKHTITLAKTDLVNKFRLQIDELLTLIGHPEALVTDRSILWDFWGEKSKENAKKLGEMIGFTVFRNTYLVDIAEEMKRIEEELNIDW